ncbi:MAG TPA: PfkB family carbohydrate kinase [Anaerolineae bacterium]|nr:PfkB family carbohydrate kinase [Anaerolineae bacterium]
MTPTPVEYLVIGHITRDLASDGGHTIGGTASYAALTAAALGRRVGILTSFDTALNTTVFDGALTIVNYQAPSSTTFENIYTNGHRRQMIYTVAATLTPAQIPTTWQQSPLVHIGPVMAECDPALIETFAGRAFIGITPQGWLRTHDTHGNVIPCAWAEAKRVLPLASAVVLSIDDIGGDWSLARHFAQQTALLVVTQGKQGGTLFIQGDPQMYPAISVTEVGPTGAGDIFASALFVALAGGAPPLRAANYAACLAGYSVTRTGLDSTPRPEEVALCASRLAYE